MTSLDERVVLITGASAGLGAALAREYAARGAVLVLLARRITRLQALADEIDPTGQRVLALECDVTQDGDLEKAVSAARETFGPIDVAIANAGWSLKGQLEELTLDDYRRQWETNVFGVLRTIYATLDDLKQTQGRLAIVSSVKSYLAFSGDSPYSTSKFALRALSESLSGELAPDGISVTHVCPAYVATEIRLIDRRGIVREDWNDSVSPRLLMGTDVTAAAIATAIERRRSEVVLTNYGKLVVFLKRHTPWFLSWLLSTLGIQVAARPGGDR